MSRSEESEVITIVKDMQKRMIYLEKKLDTLIAQSGGRDSRPSSYIPRASSYDRKERSFDKKDYGARKSGPAAKKPFYSGAKKPFKKKFDTDRE